MIKVNLLRLSGFRLPQSLGSKHLTDKQMSLIELFGPTGPLHQFLSPGCGQKDLVASPVLSGGENSGGKVKLEISIIDPYPRSLHFEVKGISFRPEREKVAGFTTDLIFRRARNAIGENLIIHPSNRFLSLGDNDRRVFNNCFRAVEKGEEMETPDQFFFRGLFWQGEIKRNVQMVSEEIPLMDLCRTLRVFLCEIMSHSYLTDDEVLRIRQGLQLYYDQALPPYHVVGYVRNQGPKFSLGVDIYKVMEKSKSGANEVRKRVDHSTIAQLFSFLDSNILEEYLAGVIGVFKRFTGEDRAKAVRKLQSVFGVNLTRVLPDSQSSPVSPMRRLPQH